MNSNGTTYTFSRSASNHGSPNTITCKHSMLSETYKTRETRVNPLNAEYFSKNMYFKSRLLLKTFKLC